MADEVAATGPHVLRQINLGSVLHALRHAPEPTARVADLMAATGLSRPAVSRALAALTAADLVEPVAGGPRQAGRPATRVRFRAELGHVAGIDVGPHTMSLRIADLNGDTRAQHRVALPPDLPGPALVEQLRVELAGLTAAAGLTPGALWAVAVGTPGVVDHERGEVLVAPSIPGWTGLHLLTSLRGWLDCPVLIDNDVNLAVLAEHHLDPTASSLLYLHWGERIGSGLIIGGTPYRGAASAAGELGFLDLATPLDQPPPPVRTGNGPFERAVGAAAIRALAVRDGGPALARALAGSADLTPLFEAVTAGDPAALGVLDTVAARFARGLAAYLLLVDPARVVIGGGLAHAGEPLLAALRRHLGPLVLVPFDLRVSALRENAVVAGAVRMALGTAEHRLAMQVSASRD